MKIRQKLFGLFVAATFLSVTPVDAADLGVVDAMRCLKDTKQGQEQEAKVKALQDKMVKVLKDKETSLNELAQKFTPEYLDSISDDEEAQMKEKFQTMGRELQSYESNYYQTMQRAQKTMQQTMVESIKDATAEIAKKRGLSHVINDDFLLFYEDSLDVTDEVITLMNDTYEEGDDDSDTEE